MPAIEKQRQLLLATLLLLVSHPAEPGGRPYETVGLKPTAIPLLNFSSDDGTGYGLRLNLFHYDGQSIPYHRAYSLQAFFTTRGKWVHRLHLDTPNFRPGQRLELEAMYEKEDFANYYGGLSDAEVEAFLGEVDSATRKRQTTFKQAFPTLRVLWIHTLRLPWRARTGLQLSHRRITPNARQGSILRYLDPLGADGGTLLQLSAALRYDTRDDYTNSAGGLLEEVLLQYGVGRRFNGVLLGFEHRHFLSPLEGWVLAHRLNVDLTLGDLPFYEELDLGGSSTVRGLAAARERGQGRLLFNAELRWQGVRLSRKQHMYAGLLLFADAGQIFSRADGPSLDEWRASRGVGLRFHWYGTIVRADYGASGKRTGLYITFSQVF